MLNGITCKALSEFSEFAGRIFNPDAAVAVWHEGGVTHLSVADRDKRATTRYVSSYCVNVAPMRLADFRRAADALGHSERNWAGFSETESGLNVGSWKYGKPAKSTEIPRVESLPSSYYLIPPTAPEYFEMDVVTQDRALMAHMACVAGDRRGDLAIDCVYFNSQIAATDGHRLNIAKREVSKRPILIPSGIISAVADAGLTQRYTLMGADRATGGYCVIAETVSGVQIQVTGETTGLHFPDYSDVIPKKHKAHVDVVASDIAALRYIGRGFGAAAKVAANKDDIAPSCDIIASGKDALAEMGGDHFTPQMRAIIGCADGKNARVRVNAEYLADAVAFAAFASGKREACIKIGDEHAPIIVGEDDAFALVMPMRR